MNPSLATGIAAACATAAVAGLAYGGFQYASLWPGSRIFGKALIAPERPGEMALTFDDGPNTTWTPRLLDALASQQARATFFLLGGRAQAAPDLVRRMAAAGHAIGNHSWDHPNLARCSSTRIREQLMRTRDTLQQIIGAKIKFFRPPYGARRPAVFRIAREMGLEPVLWNAMTSDWNEPSTERITAQLIGKIDKVRQQGLAANIVLHDGVHHDAAANREPTILAAAALLAHYRQTCRFVALDAWV
jgi:peptidoglycan-N-acetylglucosamine deacetylase